ncbi:hypothetical protein NDU88_003596 [Pleurodeles waltl]|uniref:Uncharacterized protein n=1 Tax=Pleurodeles waltl TaxID=8319 RepID=A0AAV7SGC9_PLEWA|nr:hypothetical protein NDU88_003596 [Pleurodeles waltl]
MAAAKGGTCSTGTQAASVDPKEATLERWLTKYLLASSHVCRGWGRSSWGRGNGGCLGFKAFLKALIDPNQGECRPGRLSVNPAQDAPEWRLPCDVCGEKDGLPCSLGNGNAGTSLGNPDIRVPYRTKREDGLHLGEAEDAENAKPTERKENEETTEDEERKEDDDGRRNGTAWFPRERPTSGEQKGTVIHAQTATPQEGRG